MCHLNCFYMHSSLVLSTITVCNGPSELAKLKLYTHRKTPHLPHSPPQPLETTIHFYDFIYSVLC